MKRIKDRLQAKLDPASHIRTGAFSALYSLGWFLFTVGPVLKVGLEAAS